MKSGLVFILAGCFACIAFAQVSLPSPEKLPVFETLARQTATKVIWSKEVGHLTGGESHAIFTVLIVEGSAPERQRGRGVRLDLTQPDWKTSVYVDESLLQPMKKNFEEVATTLARRPELIERGLLSRNGAIGVCDFRRNPGRYPLTAGYTFQLDLPTLILNAVWFPGLMPLQVSDVLGKSIDELKAN